MLVHGIDTCDISVVVQGPVAWEITSRCLSSIRRYLPGAEIILSTWVGSQTENLDFDQLVLNDDPGGFPSFKHSSTRPNNINRQLVSSREGLLRAERKYAVKMRTDFILKSAGFLNWFDRYSASNASYSLFQHKLVCCDVYSRNPRVVLAGNHLVCHPADFFFFGLLEDVFDLFDIPLVLEQDQVYFAQKSGTEDLPRFTPEQFLWIGFLGKYLPQEKLPHDRADISQADIVLSEATIAANFIILSHKQIGLHCGKEGLCRADNPETCISHFDWSCLYLYYCEQKTLPYCCYRIKTAAKSLRQMIKNGLRGCLMHIKGFVKKVLQKAFPAYRVAVRLEAAQREQFASLEEKLEDLLCEQEQLQKELCEINRMLLQSTETLEN